MASGGPTGLAPTAIAEAYQLPGLAPSSGAGAGQIIAIVDAYDDPNALADLNKFGAQFGYAPLSACTSVAQAGPCFEKAFAQGSKPVVNANWALEASLDIEWARAEAPAAKIVLVETASNSKSNMFGGVSYANGTGATEISMSWYMREFSGEKSDDTLMTHPGTFYIAAAGDSGHEATYPATSPNVLAVGGTTLNGCAGTSCAGFSSETTWSGSGGGTSSIEAIPSYQQNYQGPVSGAASISALTGGKRAIPDVSFDANMTTGVSVYDSTPYQNQTGWFTVGGTSVGAPNWAGLLAAGAASGSTVLQGAAAIYSGGYATSLRDVTGGTNGTCGAACTAGPGYDQVTGLGSPRYAGTWGKAAEVPGTAALNAGGFSWIYQNSMSCAAPGNCSAGGRYKDGFGNDQAYAASELRGVWGKAKEIPGIGVLNAGGFAEVISLSCGSPGNCAPGGLYEDAVGHFQAFVADQVNGTWGKAKEVPGTAALDQGGGGVVNSVSCASAGNCSAGGAYTDRSFHGQAFVVSEVNGTWDTAIEVPGTAALNKGGSARIDSVSCTSAGNCSAGGAYFDASRHFQALVVSQVNGIWTSAIEAPGSAVLNKGGGADIQSVSCASVGNCGGGGYYTDPSGATQSVVISQF